MAHAGATLPPHMQSAVSGGGHLPANSSIQQIASVLINGRAFFRLSVVVNGVCYKILVPSTAQERPFVMQYTTTRGRVARFKAMPNTTVMLKPPANQQRPPPPPYAPRNVQQMVRGGRPVLVFRQPHNTSLQAAQGMAGRLRHPTVAPPVSFPSNDFDNDEVMEGVDDAFMFYDDDVEECETTLLEDSNSANSGGAAEVEPRVDVRCSSNSSSTDTCSEVDPIVSVTSVDTRSTPTNEIVKEPATTSAIVATVSRTPPTQARPIATTTTTTTTHHSQPVPTSSDKTRAQESSSVASGTPVDKRTSEIQSILRNAPATSPRRHNTLETPPKQTKAKPKSSSQDNGLKSNTRGRTAQQSSPRPPFATVHPDVPHAYDDETDECVILSEPPTSSSSDTDSDDSFTWYGKRKHRSSKVKKKSRKRRPRRRDANYRPKTMSNLDWKDMTLNVTTRNANRHPGLKIPAGVYVKPCRVVVEKLDAGFLSSLLSPNTRGLRKHRLTSKEKTVTDSKRQKMAKTDGLVTPDASDKSHSSASTPVPAERQSAASSAYKTTTSNQTKTTASVATTTVSVSTTSVTQTVTTSIATSRMATSTSLSTPSATPSATNPQNKYVLIKTNAGNFLVPADSPLVTQAKNLSSAASTPTVAPPTTAAATTTSSPSHANASVLSAANSAPILPGQLESVGTTPGGATKASDTTSTHNNSTTAATSKSDQSDSTNEKAASESVMEERIRRLKEMLRQKEQEVELFRKKRTEHVDK